MITLLVVDDDEDIRVILSTALARPGWRVVEAEDGAVALDYIEANGLPDLILLDMNMPVMNGWDFAAELRARNLWRVPVVVITAAYDAAGSATSIGATAFAGKPFDRCALIRTIEKLLARSDIRPGAGDLADTDRGSI